MEKATLIETLEAMYENSRACSKIWKKDGERKMYWKTSQEALTLDTVIRMLKNDEFANAIRECYFPKQAQ